MLAKCCKSKVFTFAFPLFHFYLPTREKLLISPLDTHTVSNDLSTAVTTYLSLIFLKAICKAKICLRSLYGGHGKQDLSLIFSTKQIVFIACELNVWISKLEKSKIPLYLVQYRPRNSKENDATKVLWRILLRI